MFSPVLLSLRLWVGISYSLRLLQDHGEAVSVFWALESMYLDSILAVGASLGYN